MSVDDVDDICAGLTLHIDDQRRRGIRPASELRILGAGHQDRNVLEPYRRAVLVRHHHVAVVVRVANLIIGVDGVGAGRAVERSLRPVLVCVADGGAQIIEIQSVSRHGARVRHHPYRGPLAAADADDADALDLRDLLGDARIDEILHFGERHRLGGHPQYQHRSIGRVDLGVYRRRGQVLRQQIRARADRRLNLLLRDVDGQLQSESQRDHRRAGRTRRRHLIQARHLPELLLQRRRYRGGDDLGTRSRIEGLHLNGGISGDLRKRRQRQLHISHDAHDHDRQHQQRGGDRPQYEDAGWVH